MFQGVLGGIHPGRYYQTHIQRPPRGLEPHWMGIEQLLCCVDLETCRGNNDDFFGPFLDNLNEMGKLQEQCIQVNKFTV